jgi:hypothetical protein
VRDLAWVVGQFVFQHGSTMVNNPNPGIGAFLWEYSYNRMKLAQLLGRHGVFSHYCANAMRLRVHLKVLEYTLLEYAYGTPRIVMGLMGSKVYMCNNRYGAVSHHTYTLRSIQIFTRQTAARRSVCTRVKTTAVSAQQLGHLQPVIAVLPQECTGHPASSSPPTTVLARGRGQSPCSDC